MAGSPHNHSTHQRKLTARSHRDSSNPHRGFPLSGRRLAPRDNRPLRSPDFQHQRKPQRPARPRHHSRHHKRVLQRSRPHHRRRRQKRSPAINPRHHRKWSGAGSQTGQRYNLKRLIFIFPIFVLPQIASLHP